MVLVQWRGFSIRFLITPAGLLDLAARRARSDLSLTATDDSPARIAQSLLRGDKPAIRIEGDVQLAAEVNWLVDHVRWDVEEDLARIIGDAPAHAWVRSRVAWPRSCGSSPARVRQPTRAGGAP